MKFRLYLGPSHAPMLQINQRNAWHWLITAAVLWIMA